MNLFVVYLDSNPTNVVAFFKTLSDAQAYAAGLGIGSDVKSAIVTEYELVTTQHIVLS